MLVTIFKFAYLVKFISKPTINSTVFLCHSQTCKCSKTFESSDKLIPEVKKQGDTLLLCFHFHTVNMFFSHFILCHIFFCIFLGIIYLFKMAPNHSAKELSGVPNCKKAVKCLMEKMNVVDKFQSGKHIMYKEGQKERLRHQIY